MVLCRHHSAGTANLTPSEEDVGSLQPILSHFSPFFFFFLIVVKFTQDRIYCRS